MTIHEQENARLRKLLRSVRDENAALCREIAHLERRKRDLEDLARRARMPRVAGLNEGVGA